MTWLEEQKRLHGYVEKVKPPKKWISPKPKHFPLRDLGKLLKLTLTERNSKKDTKLRLYKRNDIYEDFFVDYVKGLVETANKQEKGIKLHKGQVIKIRTFVSQNNAEWDLKYGIKDCAIEMIHGLPYAEVIFDEQLRLEAVLRINNKDVKRPYSSRFRKRHMGGN